MWKAIKDNRWVRLVLFLLLTAAAVVLIALIGPLDYFAHGFESEMVEPDQVYEEDLGMVYLYWEDYEGDFLVTKDHFAGLELYLTHNPKKNTGFLCAELSTPDGTLLDRMTADLSEVKEEERYFLSTSAKLEKGQTYHLRIYAKDCDRYPRLFLVDNDYLPEDALDSNLLVGYAYAKPTFDFGQKVLLGVLIAALWLLTAPRLLPGKRVGRCGIRAGVALALTWLLAWNYLFNSFGANNPTFSTFQEDSETLVSSMLLAEEKGLPLHEYGLGRTRDVRGFYMTYDRPLRNSWAWDDGYCTGEPKLSIPKNKYTALLAMPGNYIEFANGETVIIDKVSIDDIWYVLTLRYEGPLLRSKFGPLEQAQFHLARGARLDKLRVQPYISQYGLQGWVFRALGRGLEHEQAIERLHLLCALLTAIVFVLLTAVLAVKYNRLLAGCFYAVFLLSPWVVNFARNLYWVEFTWFLPVLVGLVCAWKVKSLWWRLACYAAVLAAVAVKGLCGYEYISTVLVGCELFLFADFIRSAAARDRKQSALLLRAMLGMGLMALLGFGLALCIHARLRGDGDVLQGLLDIYERDVLRRVTVTGGDINLFKEESWASLNASFWETFCSYFHFQTDVLAGLPASFFPILSLAALFTQAWDGWKRRLDYGTAALWGVSFAAAASWFIIAKAHSASHPHMNYVLWYFGFVQVSIYILLRWALRLFQTRNEALVDARLAQLPLAPPAPQAPPAPEPAPAEPPAAPPPPTQPKRPNQGPSSPPKKQKNKGRKKGKRK